MEALSLGPAWEHPSPAFSMFIVDRSLITPHFPYLSTSFRHTTKPSRLSH